MTTESKESTPPWATVVMQDGLIYEGTVKSEQLHGIYLLIGGDESRLMLFPWVNINRVAYKIT